MGLGAFACGVAGTLERLRWALVPLPAGFKVPKRHFEGFGVLVGFGAFDGWQTAGFNAKKKLLGWALVHLPTAGKRQASTPRKSYWMPLLP